MLHWLGIKKYLDSGRKLPSHRLFDDLDYRRTIAEDTLNLNSENKILVAARELDGVQSRLQQLRTEQHHSQNAGHFPGISYSDIWEIPYPEKLDKHNLSFSAALFTLQSDIAYVGGIDTRFLTWPEYFSVLLLSYCGVAYMQQPQPKEIQQGEEPPQLQEDIAFLDFAIYVRSEIIECYGYITAYEYATKLRSKHTPPPSKIQLASANRIKKSFIDYFYRGYYTSKSDAASSFFNALAANEQNLLTEQALLEALSDYEKVNAKFGGSAAGQPGT